LKEFLAEKLLAKVLAWEPSDVAKERPLLQAMASLKYDSYEQFSPGLRFLESLALWLNQFEPADRAVAYHFVKSSLVFCSAEEMDHLVETAYQDHIRPILIAKSASEQHINARYVGRIASSDPFRRLQRETLFLGLSDGARIDTFRRTNQPNLNHEQIWQTHELSDDRVKELLEKLSSHTSALGRGGATAAKSFRSIVLLDDFSASGSSYHAMKDDGKATGKIAKFLRALADEKNPLHQLCAPGGVDLIILIYMATEQAIDHLRTSLAAKAIPGVNQFYVDTVQLVPARIKLPRDGTAEFTKLIEKYYDAAVFDVHMQKGKTKDAKYGYADCGLPVVLHHNTPNNSVAILWFYEHCVPRGLFPRVQRHREMS
jgi:hypothetical protein